MHHNPKDNRYIFTNGIIGIGTNKKKKNTGRVIRISIQDNDVHDNDTCSNISADIEKEEKVDDDNNSSICRVRDVDLSSVFDTKCSSTNGVNLLDSIVGVATFVVTTTDQRRQNGNNDGEEEGIMMNYAEDDAAVLPEGGSTTTKSILHLRAVDIHGTVLSLALSYPSLEPILDDDNVDGYSSSSSFLLPLSPTIITTRTANTNVDRRQRQHHLQRRRLLPITGSTIDYNQVCFPTSNTVVFALNPHLYCVDLGSVGGGGSSGEKTPSIRVKTRVWTNRHVVTSDPIADQLLLLSATGTTTTTTPIGVRRKTKKPRKSLGSILAKATYTLMGIPTHDADHEYEYPDDDEDEDDDKENDDVKDDDEGSSIPSIAVLTDLTTAATTTSTNDCNDANIAKVATLHSDGSLRIWVAEPSNKSNKKMSGNNNELCIPSVQRLAIIVDDDDDDEDGPMMAGEEGMGSRYIDPPIPNPSLWDPGRDALVLRGKYTFDPRSGTFEYECALYIQCYTNRRRDQRESNSTRSVVHIFRGGIVGVRGGNGGDVDESTRALPSGNTSKVQTLDLPVGTISVVDVSWSDNLDLIVMLRHRSMDDDDVSTAFYDIGEEELDDSQVVLAIYPLDGPSFYSNHVVLPPHVQDSQHLDHNHSGNSFAFCVEEEFDRYICTTTSDNDTSHVHGVPEDDIDIDNATSSPSPMELISKVKAEIDRAGMLALLQPFGRSRPSTLAVYYAMSSLNILDDGVGYIDIRPVTILSAMRKWNKPSAFNTSLAIVPVEDAEASMSPNASNSLSIYHAFASATKTTNARSTLVPLGTDVDDDDDVVISRTHDDLVAAKQSHRLKWIRLLSEIRRYQDELDEVLCLKRSTFTTFLFRGSMISAVTLGDSGKNLDGPDSATTSRNESEIMARLDELGLDLFACISSNPELRNLWTTVESLLYDGASKASSLVDGWADRSLENNLVLSQVAKLGNYAMIKLALTDSQIQLLSEMSQLESDFIETWLMSPASESSIVCTRLSISNDITTKTSNRQGTIEFDALSSAAALTSSRLESIRHLSLSRLFLAFGAPCINSVYVQQCALRFTLYCTALTWSVHQPSSTDKTMTLLENCLSAAMPNKKSSGIMMASRLADAFCSAAFRSSADEIPESSIAKLAPLWRERRVALRLLAPFIAFPSQEVSAAVNRKRMEATSECLLGEAATVAKLGEHSGSTPISLWKLASKLLVDATSLLSRVETLERHLGPMECSDASTVPLCCGVILDAVNDALNARESEEDVPALWKIAFHVAMRGSLWDKALHACISSPLREQMQLNLKNLILGMADAGALGKLVDMSLTVVGKSVSSISMEVDDREIENDASGSGTVDLFELASEFIEEAAVTQTSERQRADAMKDRPNYWSCLYALHASRGNWRQAAHAMDMLGKATVHSVSTSAFNPAKPLVLSKAASRKVMDDVCLSSQACAHAIKLVDNPSHRYLLTGNEDIPSESRLLTEEDLERRATRALALRMLSIDENSPDSIGSTLESSSRDTIDSLARFGYYDQAISVSMGVAAKRGSLPGGMDLFEEALSYILCTYLVPAATATLNTTEQDEESGLERLQSRSKIAQISASSSACVLRSNSDTSTRQSHVTSSTSNCMSWASNWRNEKAMQTSMAMDLLQQYTTVHSKRCRSLGLNIADAVLKIGSGMSKLPLWLTELCTFGLPGDGDCEGGLFAQTAGKKSGIADPAGLMRVLIRHRQYGEACDVMSSILSKRGDILSCLCESGASSRLPEEGRIDFIPYDLIDMLWDMIESIIASHSASSPPDVRSQVQSLIERRNRMERTLEMHFESLKSNEEGLVSARRLASAGL